MQSRITRLFAVVLLCSLALAAQQPAAAPPLPKPQLFGGTVTSLTNRQITVSHTSVGRSPVHRTFLIDAKTKMNRAVLKLRSKVIVRYRHLPGGDIALEIQLQPRFARPSRTS